MFQTVEHLIYDFNFSPQKSIARSDISTERAINLNPAISYFPTPERCSIIGSSRLNFRVRDGNGCDPADRITGKLKKFL